jgi:protein-tyrosine phosphatase
MNIAIWLAVGIAGLALLLSAILLGFRAAVRLGGRSVAAVDPQMLLLPGAEAVRVLRLERGMNFRTLSGYHAGRGEVIRDGVLYRSGHWGNLSDRDLDTLSGWAVRLVVDLRGTEERAQKPDRLTRGANSLWVPIFRADEGFRGITRTILFRRHLLGELMAEHYRRMVSERGEQLGEALRPLSDPANLPAVFHCAAGKDRAGVTLGLLLTLLGVPREAILADYSLSNLAFDQLAGEYDGAGLKRAGLTAIDLAPMLIADPAWLVGALDQVEMAGGIERYLHERAGITPDEQASIRSNLVGPA